MPMWGKYIDVEEKGKREVPLPAAGGQWEEKEPANGWQRICEGRRNLKEAYGILHTKRKW